MRKITYPVVGDYQIVANYFFKHTISSDIIKPKLITNKTIELGNKYSPNFVCMPFKYTLGTFIEGLENGANVLVQLGGGCRYGYYSELQEKILRDLGYKFTMVNFVIEGKANFKRIKSEFKKIEKRPKYLKILKYLIISKYMIIYMDKIDEFIRKNIGFEVIKGSFKKAKEKILNDFQNSKSLIDLKLKYKKGLNCLKKIKINKPKNVYKIGIIGELYTVMEPFSNYNLECILASHNIEITRFTNATYLLLKKGRKTKQYLKYIKEYIKYKMGADAMDNIARVKYMCLNNFDGIIHIKSSFCTPEIGAMPIINKIAHKYNIPILFFSFDANTDETGIKTRLEAFFDMLEMRRNNEELLSRN